MNRITPLVGFVIALALCVPGMASAQPDIRVTLLGTGRPDPAIDRFGPSTLVQAGSELLLFDSDAARHSASGSGASRCRQSPGCF